jgi:hypothetical protein
MDRAPVIRGGDVREEERHHRIFTSTLREEEEDRRNCVGHLPRIRGW